MKLGSRRFLASLLVSALALTACSSTSDKDEQSTGTDESPAGTAPDVADVGGGADAAGDAAAAGSAGGGTSASGRATKSGGGAAGSVAGGTATTVRQAASLPMGTGVTATEIKIGAVVAKDINAATAAVGAQTNNPEERHTTQAVVNWINASGGILGRKVVVVYHEVDPTSGTWAEHAQGACSKLVEDAKVFVAIGSSVGGDDSLAACMSQKKTPLIEENFWPFDGPAYEQVGDYLYQPGRPTPERWNASYVDALADRGFFGTGAKVGIIRFDKPIFKRMADRMTKRLQDRGIAMVDEQAVLTPRGLSDFGAMTAQIGNAIVSFRSKDVTHVLFAEYSGSVPFFMLPAAESQGFRPRYGFNSLNRPNTQSNQHGPEQMRRSMAVGWTPAEDLGVSQEKRGGAAALCLDIGKKAGVGGSASGFRLYMQLVCDSLFFLKATLERATALTAAGFKEAVTRLGTAYDSPYTYTTRFGPGRHDGAAALRVTRYDEPCDCFVYVDDRAVALP